MATTINKGSGIGEFHKFSVSGAWAIATAILLLSPYAGAAEWKIVPTLEVKETYTDNVRLAVQGAEKHDFVTQISPGISVTGTGRGLKFKTNYVMQNLAYSHEKDKNSTIHQLNADANAELLKDLFFVDGKASISQQNISSFGPQSVDNTTISDNRTDVRTYSVSPFLRHRFGAIASSELRYTHEAVNTSNGGLLPSQTDQVSFSLNSGSAFRTFGWGLQYNDQKIAHHNANSVDMASASATLRYMISEKFTLTASGGHEKNNYISIKEKPEGYFWSAGFSWKPSERTSLVTNAGKRFYGSTFSLAANHRARNTVWSLGYNEDLTTTQSQFLVPVTIDTSSFLDQLWKSSIPDPAIRQQTVETFIRNTNIPAALSQNFNTFSNRIFLQKSLQASVALNGVKNTVLLSLFNTSREAQTDQTIDGALLAANNLSQEDKTRQLGINALWNWRMSARTNANVSAGYSKISSFPIGRKSNNKTASVSLTRQFAPKLKGTIEVRRQQQTANQTDGNFRENAISASLRMGF